MEKIPQMRDDTLRIGIKAQTRGDALVGDVNDKIWAKLLTFVDDIS